MSAANPSGTEPRPTAEEKSCEGKTAEEKLELLHRIANSRCFSSAHTLRAFLLYIGENALEGNFEAIKEQQIGARVLGRKPDYDPAEDNIVRVRARQLRQRLSDYFSGEGREEQMVVSIPKGHYIPVFEPREEILAPAAIPMLEAADLEALAPEKVPVPGTVLRGWRRYGVLIGVLAAILVVLIWLRWPGQAAKAAKEVHTADATDGLWSQLFLPGGPELTVVSADAGFALWQDITGHDLNLGDYLSRRWYTEGEANSLKMQEIAIRRFTSPADLVISAHIAELASAYNSRAKIEFARNVDIHEVRSGSIVLIGSRRSNPWVEVFEPKMNFVLEFDTGLGPGFRNRAPKAGEPKFVSLASRLSVQGPERRLTESYAVAAFMPSPAERGNVLIVEGLSMEGTEAAGEFVLNSKRFGAFLRRIGADPHKPLKPFEALLKLSAVSGGYADPELVAYRYPAQ